MFLIIDRLPEKNFHMILLDFLDVVDPRYCLVIPTNHYAKYLKT